MAIKEVKSHPVNGPYNTEHILGRLQLKTMTTIKVYMYGIFIIFQTILHRLLERQSKLQIEKNRTN